MGEADGSGAGAVAEEAAERRSMADLQAETSAECLRQEECLITLSRARPSTRPAGEAPPRGSASASPADDDIRAGRVRLGGCGGG